jgi:diaminopimelate epimerase
MEKLLFTKMHGAGNDFILVDKILNPQATLSAELVKQICHRNFGIGADGVLFFNENSNLAYDLIYFNADGTTGSLCGNGARCGAYYAFSKGVVKEEKFNFNSNGRIYSAEVLEGGGIKFYFNQPERIKLNFKVKFAEQLINASFADTGTPHLVINIADVMKNPKDISSKFDAIDEFPVFEFGRGLRYHNDFAPNGVNVNFIQITESGILIRTYERGVENETLACGTGSAASALTASINYKIKAPVNLITKGGSVLIVDFNYDGTSVNDFSLTGPAQIVFNGEFKI